jgi:Zn-finger nucleic acid-binding protein
MRNYERNEVMVDQCNGCGGLFLDRGELERLYSAESAFYESKSQPAQPQPAPAREAPPHSHQPPPHQPRYDDHSQYRSKPRKSKKRSFLEEFFD